MSSLSRERIVSITASHKRCLSLTDWFTMVLEKWTVLLDFSNVNENALNSKMGSEYSTEFFPSVTCKCRHNSPNLRLSTGFLALLSGITSIASLPQDFLHNLMKFCFSWQQISNQSSTRKLFDLISGAKHLPDSSHSSVNVVSTTSAVRYELCSWGIYFRCTKNCCGTSVCPCYISQELQHWNTWLTSLCKSMQLMYFF